jgi:hypothetical protein
MMQQGKAKVGTAPSTTTITFPDGTTLALEDWIDDRLYGSVQFDSGLSSPLELFSSARAQQIPGGSRNQTYADTNIPKAGSNGLPKDWAMLVYGIALKPVRAMRPNTSGQVVLGDVNGALSNPLRLQTLFGIDRLTFFQFFYNDKFYSQGTLADFPQGNGYSVFSTNTAFEIAQNGIASPRDRIALVIPIYMEEGLGYFGSFAPQTALAISQPASDGGTALTSTDWKGTLNGLIKRTVV